MLSGVVRGEMEAEEKRSERVIRKIFFCGGVGKGTISPHWKIRGTFFASKGD